MGTEVGSSNKMEVSRPLWTCMRSRSPTPSWSGPSLPIHGSLSLPCALFWGWKEFYLESKRVSAQVLAPSVTRETLSPFLPLWPQFPHLSYGSRGVVSTVSSNTNSMSSPTGLQPPRFDYPQLMPLGGTQ